MKKHLIKLLLLSSLALTGCNTNTSSSVEPSSPSTDNTTTTTTDTTPSTTEVYPNATVTSKSTSYQVERKQSITVRVTVSTQASSKFANFELVQDEEYVTIDESASLTGVTAITLTGKKAGTAKLVATAAVNPNAKLEILITVIGSIPAVSKVWEKVVDKTNYTVDVSRAPTEDEVDANGWDDDDAVPSARIRVTDKAIVREVATSVDKDLKATWGADSALHQDYTDTTNNTTHSVDQYGYGIDKNGYAITLAKDNNTFMDSSELSVIKTSSGLLDKDTFLGAGENATSPNDVGTFFGLQAINPSWLPSTKDKSNIYSLDGDGLDEDSEEKTYLAFAETLLWEMVDFAGFYQVLASGTTSYVDLAAYVSTSITALSTNSISFEVIVNDGYTYTATLSNVGTTKIENEFTTYLTTAEGKKPSLVSGLEAFRTGIEGHDYVVTNYYYASSSSTTPLTYKTYFTPNYVMTYYDQEFVTEYNKTATNKMEAGGSILAKFNDGIHYLEYTPSSTEGETGTVIDNGLAFTSDTSKGNLWDYNFGQNFSSYLESSDFFNGDYFYTLSSEQQTIFTGYASVFWTQTDATAEKFYEWWAGSSMSSQYKSRKKLFGIHVDTTTVTENGQSVVKASSVSFLLGLQDSSTGYYSIYYTPTISDFGSATTNDADTLIKDKINSSTTTE